MRPTDEQLLAVEKFRSGRPLKIAAFAGAGKTSTLKMLAEARQTKGVYLAFNRSIAAEAKAKFPRNVDCRTTHAIAFRAVMPIYGSAPKMTTGLYARQIAEEARYNERVFRDALRLTGVHQAHLVLGTIRQFCQSADPAIALSHVPTYGRLLGASKEVLTEVQAWAQAQAMSLWSRMTDTRDQLPLGHDGYLKVWALQRPTLAADYILLDEAQDTNPVVLGVLRDQRAQIVYVGDKHQQIYEWRGAVNAMEQIPDCEEAYLTQSFRFGETIAATASQVLATLGERRSLRGNPSIHSSVGDSGQPVAVLSRTNATVISELLLSLQESKKPHVCGGTKDLARLLSDVYELKAGKPAVSPEFFGFQRWKDVVEFSESEEGQDLKTFVQLVEQHGEGKLWSAVKQAEDKEEDADVILSTAHKAKGREWASVRLSGDFMNSRAGAAPAAPSEVRLFYVAMTRAQKSLIVDRETLNTFTTDAWKKRNPGTASARPSAYSPRPAPQTPRANQPPRLTQPVTELSPPSVARRHPASATTSGANSSGPTRGIVEIGAQTAAQRHPSHATSRPAPASSGGSAPSRSGNEPATLWRRLTRIFRSP
jgi:hypothetical protein